MPEQLQKIYQPLKTRWDGLDRQQRIKLIAAVLVVVLALGLTVYFTTRTKYELFVIDREPTEILQIEAALNTAGIKSRRANNNTAIEVDAKRLADAKTEMDTNTAVSNISFTFADALTASGMSSTETIKREALRRAKQTELADAIKSIRDVLDANVQLSIPDSTRFILSTQEPSKASVYLKTARDFNRNEGLRIARLVCRSVEGLDMENIEIYDDKLNTLYSGLQEESNTGVGSLAEIQEQERSLVHRQILQLYQPLFNDVKPAINLQYDNNISTEEHITTITPPVTGSETGVITRDTGSKSTMSGSPSAATPGLEANDQASATYETDNGTTYKGSTSEYDTSYGYDQSETRRTSGPGSYLRNTSSVTVNLYKNKLYYQEYMLQRKEIASEADWQDFKDKTSDAVMINDPNIDQYVESIAIATGIDVNNVRVYVWEIPVFYDYTKAPVEIQQIVMFAVLALLILMLAYGLIRRTKPEEEEEVEPELSVEDLLVSTQLEEAKEEAASKLDDIGFKESEIKKQIEKFVNEKPEAVAQLLRNWLNSEEW